MTSVCPWVLLSSMGGAARQGKAMQTAWKKKTFVLQHKMMSSAYSSNLSMIQIDLDEQLQCVCSTCGYIL